MQKHANVPRSLVFAIATLYNLVFSGQDLLLEDLCAAAFVDTGDFQDLGGVDKGISPPSHDRYATNHALVDLVCDAFRVSEGSMRGNTEHVRTCTEE